MGCTRQFAGAVLLAMAPAAPAIAKNADAAAYAKLASAVDDAVAAKGVPSAVVVMFDEHHILWSHVAGYADVAAKRPPTLKTRYRLGSMAKAVTSTVLAMAQQKRLISLDAPITMRTAEDKQSLPVRDALNMQAGMAQAVCYQGITGDRDPDCGAGFDRRFSVAMTAGHDRYAYSNMGPEAGADALAQRLDQPFEQVAHRLLFSPAGLVDMTYDHSRPATAPAVGYDGSGKPYPHDFHILPAAGAGLEASAADLVRFGQLHLTGRAPDGKRLLAPGTLSLLHSAPNGGFYGYGWGRIGRGKSTELLISDGQVNGGQAMLLLNPDRRVGAVVVSNAANDEVSALALKAIDTVVPGTAQAFAMDVAKEQAIHVAQVAAFLPPRSFKASGFLRVDNSPMPVEVDAKDNRLSFSIAGEKGEQDQSEEDEGLRGWEVPCPRQIPACLRPGARAKLWLSRDGRGLGGQLQVTSFNGQLPYAVRLRFH